MNTLEERIATGLRSAYDAVPEATGDLSGVKRAGRRRSMVRKGSVVVAAAAVTLLAVGSAVLLRPASFQSVSETIVAAAATTVTTSAAEQTTITEAAAEETVTTIGVSRIDPASIPVGLSEYEVDLDKLEPLWGHAETALRARPDVEMSPSLVTDIQTAAAQILADIGAEPPFGATLVQQAGYDQFVLIEHSGGSCLTVVELPREREQSADPRGCTPSDPVVWDVGGEGVVVWWDLPASAAHVGAVADCGSAAVCAPESTPVLNGVAVLPTTYQGLPLRLTAYDDEGAELASEVVQLPPREVPKEEGWVITLDGEMIRIEMPLGTPFPSFAAERGGWIRDVETGERYFYAALNRKDTETRDVQVPPGEVRVSTETIRLRSPRTVVAIGLERGTVFVTVPEAEGDVDAEAWAGAFVDLIGDGESTLVIEAGPGYELLASETGDRPGTQTTLIGDEGAIFLTTGGCVFDWSIPEAAGEQELEQHERVGTVHRSGDSATWCADDLTVTVVGPPGFIDWMLAELTVTP